MSLALTILGLLARYLPLGIQAIETGATTFEAVNAVAAKIHASAANPTMTDRAAAEAEIAKLESLLRGHKV